MSEGPTLDPPLPEEPVPGQPPPDDQAPGQPAPEDNVSNQPLPRDETSNQPPPGVEASSQPSRKPPASARPGRVPPKRRRPRGAVRSLVEWVVTAGVAVGLVLLIQAFLVKPYAIPSPSMVPTLDVGQHILVNRLDTHPGLGDVVVFHPPEGALIGGDGVCGNANEGSGHQQACDYPRGGASSQTYVKRVVGLPGDHLRIIGGKVFRNGKQEHGSYIQPCDSGPASCQFPKEITVPPGHYFMMGDNRGVSDDSRFWGPIAQSWIIGTAFFTYWPPHRIGTL